jgi:hypothetical protein
MRGASDLAGAFSGAGKIPVDPGYIPDEMNLDVATIAILPLEHLRIAQAQETGRSLVQPLVAHQIKRKTMAG